MLKLKNIVKNYVSGEDIVHALKGIDLDFRESEFVSILGPSGCGKTTLLNIIGGLDKYTSGDLIINGKSTKDYTDKDWDTYRNHSIGFVFQSYNLIPHQTVLENVELALTLSGVSKKERKERAIKALEQVGLKDQIKKKPNQLSGGQMQRVAIARALVNDPDIILADEPTGALDTETSVQIMDILKSISKEKLIIMVTHNPELAQEYSNRIIKLVDGKIIDDSNPYKEEEKIDPTSKQEEKTSMSFITALSLSVKNLFTKKARTILTSFAGSIGIVGIALILSVSSGVTNYINTVEESTMASFPIIIEKNTADVSSMMTTFLDQEITPAEDGYIESNDLMITLMDSMSQMEKTNNVTKFRDYIESDESTIKENANDIIYNYAAHLNTYYLNEDGEYSKTYANYYEMFAYIYSKGMISPTGSSSNSIFTQMVGNEEFIESQYDLVYGEFPSNDNEVLISVDENNKISDYVLYSLGMRDLQEIIDYNTLLEEYEKDPENKTKPSLPEPTKYTYEDVLKHEFKVLLDSDLYKVESGLIKEKSIDEINTFLKSDEATTLKISGIVKPSEESQVQASIGSILYKKDMMTNFIEEVNNSDVVTLQKENTKTNLLANRDFDDLYTDADYQTLVMMIYSDNTLLTEFITTYEDANALLDVEKVVAFANDKLLGTHESCLTKLGYIDFTNPNSIHIYPLDFDAKEAITEEITRYNSNASEDDQIVYTDMVGMLLESVNIIVNAISYVLIAFVSISLVVSSIMIGIITYISVLERTKEIGVLRAIGASKKDVSRVFNAETLIIGFAAGALGIITTLILIIPINIILHAATGISYLSASLPVVGAIVLILISVGLTMIAGLIPSRLAAKKDPVIALRTE